MEIWKDILWSDGFYEVSDMGNVRSKDRVYMRKNGRPSPAKGRRVPCHWSDGYVRVRLNVPGFPKWHTVHKLVMETFIGPRPDGMVIAHRDGAQQNNRLSNLRYATNAENQSDRKDHGTWHDQTDRLITPDQVQEMRNRRFSGETLKTLASDFGVSVHYVSMVCLGKMFSDLPGPISAPMEKAAHRKLPEDKCREIVRRRLAGENIVPLGKEFGISHSYVSTLVKRYAK